MEIHPDLTRVFSIPFSPYPKETINGKPVMCMPFNHPDQILDYHPTTLDHLQTIQEIAQYPEPTDALPLFQEARNYYQSKEYHPAPEPYVSIDNLPSSYKHLENGVEEGRRDNAVTRLVGVFKTCGLSRSQTLQELLKFNSRCRPPLPESVVREKVRRFIKNLKWN